MRSWQQLKQDVSFTWREWRSEGGSRGNNYSPTFYNFKKYILQSLLKRDDPSAWQRLCKCELYGFSLWLTLMMDFGIKSSYDYIYILFLDQVGDKKMDLTWTIFLFFLSACSCVCFFSAIRNIWTGARVTVGRLLTISGWRPKGGRLSGTPRSPTSTNTHTGTHTRERPVSGVCSCLETQKKDVYSHMKWNSTQTHEEQLQGELPLIGMQIRLAPIIETWNCLTRK